MQMLDASIDIHYLYLFHNSSVGRSERWYHDPSGCVSQVPRQQQTWGRRPVNTKDRPMPFVAQIPPLGTLEEGRERVKLAQL